MKTWIVSLAALVLLAGPASAAPRACPAGLRAAVTAELYFGRDIGGVLGVSDVDWKDFLDHEVTPRFPDGLTVSDAEGQWRRADGAVAREPSKRLFLVLAGKPGERARLEAIRAAYKRRFRQESVLLVEQRACVGF